MELPHIGEHCEYGGCNRLDFLPIQCELCKKKFCNDHHKFEAHLCPESYTLDARVPVCPLCNKAVPYKRNEAPDIAVNEHITNNCYVKKNKIYTNKCSFSGCKAKELVNVQCDSCQINFCLRHRNPIDHECKGAAAARRNRTLNGSIFKNWISSSSSSTSVPQDSKIKQSSKPRVVQPSPQSRGDFSSLQGNLSEEEALQRALRASTLEENTADQGNSQCTNEDLALAQAISASINDERRNRNSNSSCNIS